MNEYDVIVIDGGAPGEHCAGALAEGGLHVALLERELVGGECSHWACIPSKTLLRPGEAVHGAREAAAKAEVDIPAALAWRDFMVSNYSDAGQQGWLAKRGIGDVTGIWPLTHVGKYQGEVVASNILGEPREVNYEAVPRAVFTDPQAAAVGANEARFSATAALKGVAKTATYTVAYAESNGFLTLLSDGDRLTGAYALGTEAGEWLQQATLAIRARVPLAVLRDTIQPFPTFSEIFVDALHALHVEVRKAASAPFAGSEARP